MDQWELYDLEADPQELHNVVNDESYADIKDQLHHRLEELQDQYLVTDKEFEKASPEAIERSYKVFERLSGKPMKAYKH